MMFPAAIFAGQPLDCHLK